MKPKQVLSACAMAVLLTGWGLTPAVLAREAPATFSEALGSAATATDKYGLLCAPEPGVAVTATANVTDPQADPVHFHVCIGKADGSLGQCREAPNPGSAPAAVAAGGPGFYIVEVLKAPAGTVEPYTVVLACRNAANFADFTSGAVFLLQDQ